MPASRHLRSSLASQGPASEVLNELVAGPSGLLDPPGVALTAGAFSARYGWSRFERCRAVPGRALSAARMVVASATLSSFALMTATGLAEAASTGLALRPAAELVGADTDVAVFPTPGPEAPRDADEAPAPPPAPPAGTAPEAPPLSRVPAAARPAPAAAPADPPPPELAGPAALSRLSRAEVLAALPIPTTPTSAAPEPQPDPVVVPAAAGALPLGKGMWLYVPEEIEGGNVDALVARASQVGLTHVYVRTGSSRMGFHGQAFMDELLPKAHAAGIRVYGWDFPYLHDVGADVARSLAAITHTAPGGHRIDGFAADIETASEGTNLSAEGAAAYGHALRQAVGPAYPLVAVVPRPSSKMQMRYPYAAVIPDFDAVAPMTYWLNRQPDSDVVNDVSFLAAFGKPVIPIGQAYDGAGEGGRPGPPPPEEIQRFLSAAQEAGAAGASFWSWQHASQAIWDTIQAAPEFRWEARPPAELGAGQVRALQTQLTKLGFPVPASGTWDDLTTTAVAAYQEQAGLPRTGVVDGPTLAVIMTPFNPPVRALLPEAVGGDVGLEPVEPEAGA